MRKGQRVAATIIPLSDLDTYPTHDSNLGRGGHHSVQSYSNLLTIPEERLMLGMTAYVIDEDKTYCYKELNGVKSWSLSKAESAFAEDKPLISPTIERFDCIVKNNAGTVVPTSSVEINGKSSIRAEVGYKIDLSLTYKWKSLNGYKNPTSIHSSSDFKDFPSSDVESKVLSYTDITSPKTISAVLQSPKVGLIVQNGKVITANGQMDISSCNVRIDFYNTMFYGVGRSTLSVEDMKRLTSIKTNGKNGTLSVNTSESEFFYYCYPKSFGQLSSIIQNGALPVLGAFTVSELQYTNEAGLAMDYYVYRSNNAGAFSNVKLQFL